MDNFKIRDAMPTDCQTLLDMMIELAYYEKIEDQFVGNYDLLHNALFVSKDAEALLIEENNICVGYAIFCHNFSTFKCKKGLYLEDLYVKPHCRGKGYGKSMLLHLVELAKQRGCGRVEWVVLDWNQQAIDLYNSLGAEAIKGWTIYRIDSNNFSELNG